MKKFIVCVLAMFLMFSSSFAVEGTNKTIKLNKVIFDEISEKGEVDYFNFYISKSGSVKVNFEFDIEGAYTVKLVDVANNKTIQNNSFKCDVNTSNGRSERSSNKMRLGNGNYQVQVSCSSFCDEGYELEIEYEEENSDRYEKESNNAAKTAMIIDYNKKVIGNLESTSDVDYYMVEIPHKGEIYTELEFNRNVAYNVEIYSEVNGSLKSLQSKKFEAKLNQSSDTYVESSDVLRIPAGNYYIKVNKSGSNYLDEDYAFLVKYSKNLYGNYESENNNDAKTANKISVNTEFIGNLSSKSDVDYYRVDVLNSNKLKVKMNVPANTSYTVTTYKEVNGELSKLKSETLTSKELAGIVMGAEQEISTGTYYFKIASKTYSNQDYTFLVETNNTYIYGKKTVILEINNPYMMVDGKSYAIDGNRGTAPKILNGRTMIPARALIEALGGTVYWNESVKGINIYLGQNNVYLTLDSALAYVNGETRWLDVAPTSINGRTMIPVKFVMDNLGGSVIWNATTGTVTITY